MGNAADLLLPVVFEGYGKSIEMVPAIVGKLLENGRFGLRVTFGKGQ